MLKSWKFWAVLAAIGTMVGLFTYGFTVDPKLVKSPLLQKTAPDFEVSQLNGPGKITLSQLKGKPVILNFWASWCFACRAESVVLKNAYNQYELKQGKARVIGIAIQDTPEKALAFATQYGKNYFLALDDKEGTISLNYGLYGVPETFFIDHEGKIHYKHVGAVTREIVDSNMREMLNRMEKGAQ